MASLLQDQGWKQAELWKVIKIQPYPEAIVKLGLHAYKNKVSEHRRRLGDEVVREGVKGRARPISLDPQADRRDPFLRPFAFQFKSRPLQTINTSIFHRARRMEIRFKVEEAEELEVQPSMES